MKVNGNDRTFDYATRSNGQAHFSNIPIRLEIASRLLASSISNVNVKFDIMDEAVYNTKKVLVLADLLIAEHNKACEGKDA